MTRWTSRWRIPFAAVLLMLAASILVPSLLFAGLLFSQLEASDRAVLERRVFRQAKAFALSTDSVLREMSSSLRLVSSAPELLDGDLQGFHARTKQALANTGAYVLVVDDSGRQLLNTRVEWGAPLGTTSNMEGVRKALSANAETVSNVFLGGVSGVFVFNMLLPLNSVRNSAARVAITTRNAADLQRVIEPELLPPGWNALLLDGAGAVVVGSHYDKFPQGKAPAGVGKLEMPSGDGVLHERQGAPKGALVAYSAIGGSGWRMVLLGPANAPQAPVAHPWRTLLWGGGVLLLISCAAVALISRGIGRAIAGIDAMAHEVGEGGVVSPATSRIREFDTIAKSLSDASFERSEAENQVHVVAGELAHRTKNLMTVIDAMVRQVGKQSGSVGELQDGLRKRIQGLARSVDLLTAGHWGGVSFKSLVANQFSAFGLSERQFRLDGEDFEVVPGAVQNLGMVLHELTTNAIKHGALSRPDGVVEIAWRSGRGAPDEAAFTLSWSEKNGPPARPPESEGFGSLIIGRHAEGVFGGRVNAIYGEQGFRWEIVAPLAKFRGVGPPHSGAGAAGEANAGEARRNAL